MTTPFFVRDELRVALWGAPSLSPLPTNLDLDVDLDLDLDLELELELSSLPLTLATGALLFLLELLVRDGDDGATAVDDTVIAA
jgi:hypothetical protein